MLKWISHFLDSMSESENSKYKPDYPQAPRGKAACYKKCHHKMERASLKGLTIALIVQSSFPLFVLAEGGERNINCPKLTALQKPF